MDQSTAFIENTRDNFKKELQYEPPELTLISMLDESAVGFSGMEEPLPPE